MKRSLVKALLTLLVLAGLFFSACASQLSRETGPETTEISTPQPVEETTETKSAPVETEEIPIEASVGGTLDNYPDIPIPEGARLVEYREKEGDQIDESFTFEVSLTLKNLKSFYLNQMPNYGWRLKAKLVDTEEHMAFDFKKGEREILIGGDASAGKSRFFIMIGDAE